jgi:tetratricopeptide (TPR) repeat protein
VQELARESGDRNWQYEAMLGLGRIHHAAGRPVEALEHHHEALRLAEELAQPADVARAHDSLAHAYKALNQHESARDHWRRALDILTAHGLENAEDDETTASSIRANLE